MTANSVLPPRQRQGPEAEEEQGENLSIWTQALDLLSLGLHPGSAFYQQRGLALFPELG